jgi:hypothetical protein
MNTLHYKLCATSLLFAAALLIPTEASAQAVIVDQNDVVLPPSQVAVEAATFQTVGWRGRYYGRPYDGYYGVPSARYYARYPGYYDPYYRGYGYGYGGYYGRPYGYGYRGYPYGRYGGRVGPVRVFWR